MADHCVDISSRLRSARAYESVRSNRHPALLYLSHEEIFGMNVLETTAQRPSCSSLAPPQRFLFPITHLCLTVPAMQMKNPHLCPTKHVVRLRKCGVRKGARPVDTACCRGVVCAVYVWAHVLRILLVFFSTPSFRCAIS